ncbi:MAG: methionine adenosyltransferase [Myxococcota bacterium]
MRLVVERTDGEAPSRVEVVERKGLGHPDTLCDALADEVGRTLCRAYLDRFGTILHYNVDKALLIGGVARAAFGGGEVVRPFEIVLAGRATRAWRGEAVPVEEIALATVDAWLRRHLHALDPARHVRVTCRFGPASADLDAIFARGLSNDTSIGIGYAPGSPLEQAVLSVERGLRAAGRPELGEDVKVMGARVDDHVDLTVACAMVGRHLPDLAAYVEATHAVRRIADEAAGGGAEVTVNAADDLARGDVYLTVTGTSAEAGDDGEVGRGNRVNGLITPCRPMSLEAAAGKNLATHVGRLYNTLAFLVAEDLVAAGATEATCLLLSRIGHRIDDPPLAHVRLRGDLPDRRVEEVLRARLDDIAEVRARILAGELGAW